MADSTMYIGVLSLELYFPSVGSLKGKRSILKSVLDKIRSRFNVSAAEIGELDKWQKTICGICMIGNDKDYLGGALQKVLSFVENEKDLEVIDYQIVFT